MSRRARLTRCYADRLPGVAHYIDRLAARMSDGDQDLCDDLRQEGRLAALFFASGRRNGDLDFTLRIRAAIAHRIYRYVARERSRGLAGALVDVTFGDTGEVRHA